MQKKKVVIVGAGVSGLIAAIELEKNGNFDISIIEATDRVGGRVKTDELDGFLLDRGFQVLLTNYPEAKKYLDYEKLNLQYFNPGALIFSKGKKLRFSDPLRQPKNLLNMIFSSVGTLKDKLLLLKLNRELKKLSPNEIFEFTEDKTTLQYLYEYGFSNKIISNFFTPFFRGIFLENDLITSYKMFLFVFKMFGEGDAAIPENGMEEIPKQLKSKLKTSTFKFNTKVEKIQADKITLENNENLFSDFIIVATDPSSVIPNLSSDQFEGFHSVTNMYFFSDKSFINEPLIALMPDENRHINNVVVLTDISEKYAQKNKALISVSFNGTLEMSESELIKKIKLELKEVFNLKDETLNYLRTYEIKKALPRLSTVNYDLQETSTKLTDNVYLAGDYLLNSSLNAAMLSGRKAAEAIMLKP